MGRIGDRFQVILSRRKKAFIPFFTAFYPSKETFRELLLRADDIGADFIEVGIPFSDPLADGGMIQYSSQWTLQRNFSLSGLMDDVGKLKGRLRSSIILMSYFNPLLKRGLINLAREIDDTGIDGVIVSDLPLEESFPLKRSLSSRYIDLIYLIAPPTRAQRIQEISRHSQGFVYLVSLRGVTGMRHRLPGNLAGYIKKVRTITAKPLCVGFGISNAHQARKVADYSDGVIVGSALINLIKGRETEKSIPKKVEMYLKELRKAI